MVDVGRGSPTRILILCRVEVVRESFLWRRKAPDTNEIAEVFLSAGLLFILN